MSLTLNECKDLAQQGSTVLCLLDFEECIGKGIEGTSEAVQFPFSANNLRLTREQLDSAVLRGSRQGTEAIDGNTTVSGDITVPLDVRYFGFWLCALLGFPVTEGLATFASGTITIDDNALIAGDTFTVDGTNFVEGVDFNAGGDANATAAVLSALIDALANVSASAVGNIITILAANAGNAGNSIALSYSDSGSGVAAILSGANLSGGTDSAGQPATGTITVEDFALLTNDIVIVDGIELTEGVDWNANTDNNTTASSLAAVIDALANVSAIAAGNVITITYDTVGVAGNAVRIEYCDSASGDGINLSGARLSGGFENGTFKHTFTISNDRLKIHGH